METNLTSIPTHFGDPRVAINPATARREPFQQHFTYRNYLGTPVSLGLRNGLKIQLEPEPNLQVKEFVSIVELSMDPQVTSNVLRVLSAADAASCGPELKTIRDLFLQEMQVNKHGGARIVLEYPVSLEQLETAGGSVYFSELDLVVSILDPGSMPAHPESEEGRRNHTIAGSPVEHGGVGFGYAVEIVDNHGRYGKRYLNINRQVFPVVPKRDFARRDGVYIISNHAASGDLEKNGTKVTYCAFEQAEEAIGLFRTYEEALHLGDLAAGRKEEILNLEHELNRAKAELQTAKLAGEKEMLAAKQELTRLEGENARLLARNQLLERDMEIERQKNKDYYESKSADRKDQSETLKTTNDTIKILPTILLGIATIIGTIIGIIIGGKSASA